MEAGGRAGHKRKKKMILTVVAAALVVPLYFGWSTKAPEGTSYMSPPSTVSDLRMIYDLTYIKDGQIVYEQNILDEQIKMIETAQEFVVADIFLYNDFYNTEKNQFPQSTQKITDALVSQKQENPELKAYLITDEINNSYGPRMNEQLLKLKENGIEVIVTDSSRIRDSNPVYAGYYRTYLSHFGTAREGWMKNPFGDNGPKVGIRNYLRLLNLKPTTGR